MGRTRKKRKLQDSKDVENILEIDLCNLAGDDVTHNECGSSDVVIDPFADIGIPENETEISESLVDKHQTETSSHGLEATIFSVENPISIKKLIRKQKKDAKKNRETGKEYRGYRRYGSTVKQDVIRSARKPGPNCSSKYCIKNITKHCNQFSEIERSIIFKKFWKMNWDQKKFYACNLIESISTEESITDESSRSRLRKYFLMKSNNKKLRVCRKMYLNTLGLKEKMVRLWLNSKLEFGFFDNPIDVQEKINIKRREGKTYKINHERKYILREFLIKYPKLESHYCRKNSKKLYFQTEHRTYSKLYKEYEHFCKARDCRKLSMPLFSRTIKSLNYSLFKPKKDQCDTCVAYTVGNVFESDYRRHRNEVELARKEKEKDILNALLNLCIVLCMDVEAVQLLPKLKTSAQYFKMKLQIHNFTIYDVATHKSMNYVWDETEGELKASIFASIICQHIEKLHETCNKPIIVWSDGCCYQNRNAVLSSALFNLAKEKSIDIVQKYLIKGHTQMECDSSHALIEREARDKTINLPSDFVAAITTARINPFPLDVQHLSHEYFFNYEDPEILSYKSIRQGRVAGDPTVTDLRCLKYSSNGIYFKLSFQNEYQLLPRKPVGRIFSRPKKLYEDRIPITWRKFNDLQELKEALPSNSHHFYDTLKHDQPINRKKSHQ